MYFGLGGHPGFNVPLEAGLSLEDYCLEFSEKANPSRVLFTDDCYRTGENVDAIRWKTVCASCTMISSIVMRSY